MSFSLYYLPQYILHNCLKDLQYFNWSCSSHVLGLGKYNCSESTNWVMQRRTLSLKSIWLKSPTPLNQKLLCKLQMKTIENSSSLRLPFVEDTAMIWGRKLTNIHVKNFISLVECYRRTLLRSKCIDLLKPIASVNIFLACQRIQFA